MNNLAVIKKRRDFLFVGKFAARSKTANIIVLCLKHDNQNSVNVGYTASKKVGNAVKRNRAKRRLRSLVQNSNLCCKNGCSFVFIATPNLINCEFCDLKSDFDYCVNKAFQRAHVEK